MPESDDDSGSLAEMLAEAEARQEEMFASMEKATPVEALGVVDEITGFGRRGEESMSIELKPWRWHGGGLETCGLYVRKRKIHQRELRQTRTRLPRFTLVRVRVRPDQQPRADGELWDCLLEEIVETAPQDAELAELAEKLREAEPPEKPGRPAFDPWWLLFDLLGRLIKPPDIPIVPLGRPLPAGDWLKQDQPTLFDECEVFERSSEIGTITAGVLGDTVEGVQYDLEIYRGNGPRRMRKLQTLIAGHSEATGKLYRIGDNQAGAMRYRDFPGTCYAVYAYNTDMFMIHSNKTTFRRYDP